MNTFSENVHRNPSNSYKDDAYVQTDTTSFQHFCTKKTLESITVGVHFMF